MEIDTPSVEPGMSGGRVTVSRYRALFLANIMLAIYLFSMGVSIAIALVVGHYSLDIPNQEVYYRTLLRMGPYYDVPMALLLILIIYLYERPIRTLIRDLFKDRNTSDTVILSARRRLLNEPFFLILLNMVAWIGAAGMYGLLANLVFLAPELAAQLIVTSLLTAVISVLITFFLLQYVLQRWLAPVLFPEGGLTQTQGTLRVTLAVRLAALVSAVCLAPFLIIGVTLYGAQRQQLKGAPLLEVFDQLLSTLTLELILFSVLAAVLTYLIAVNISHPFREIIAVLHRVKMGRFKRRVRVVSNDEVGYTGDAINAMIEGLKERERMQQSLSLAREVQQNLLPAQVPEIPGLEIAGRSLYCDETGGDYYDFIALDRGDTQKWAAVIGDVSGHGISAALLMTTVRAMLRFRAPLPGSGDEIVEHLNRQFCMDTAESGQFLTLFYLELDPPTRKLEWVRAGHEPACLYRSEPDGFVTLEGPGVALGLNPEAAYTLNSASASPGDILVLTTDGIFETRQGQEMFGRKRFKEIVRLCRHLSAAEICDAILKQVNDYRGSSPQEDDVTLVVIKFLAEQPSTETLP